MDVDDDDLAALVAGAEQHLAELAADEIAMELIPFLMRLDLLLRRGKAIQELRRAKGKELPESTRRLFQQIHDEMAATAAILKGDTE